MKKTWMFLITLSLVSCSNTNVEEKTRGAASTGKEESPWTNWSKKNAVSGLLALKNFRDELFDKNLHDVETNYQNPDCSSHRAQTARMADGSCNDLEKTGMGMAGVSLGRNVKLDKINFPTEEEMMTPNPRTISRELLTRKEFKPVPFLNLFTTAWIQFMNHDWFDHDNVEEEKNRRPYWLELDEKDPFRLENKQSSMMTLRTRVNDENRREVKGREFTSFKNTVTHWWDASQIYGSSEERVNSLRYSRNGGQILSAKLKVKRDKSLPIEDVDGIELTGFKENWWTGISLLHHLFVYEHNAIVDMLRKEHPQLSEQEVFDKARLINSAVMAKIHTVEWTPAVLPNFVLDKAMKANWFGVLNPGSYTTKVGKWIAKIPGLRRTDYKIPALDSSAILGGLVGGKKNLYGVPFTITEEFTSVYRLHPLLPESLKVKDVNKNFLGDVPLAETRLEKSKLVTKKYGFENLIYSMGAANAGALTLNNYPRFLQNLEMPIVGKMDLGTVEILRDRERGVPRYNEFRRQINLKPISRFEDFFIDPKSPESREMLEKLKRIYNNDVEQIDLLVGCLAEQIRPKNFGFGETAFQIFILMASRRLLADRFYTTHYTKDIYTQEGLDWIDQKGDFKSLVLRHFPNLEKAFEGVENPFNPWN